MPGCKIFRNNKYSHTKAGCVCAFIIMWLMVSRIYAFFKGEFESVYGYTSQGALIVVSSDSDVTLLLI